jgi:hypothetical protein
MHKIPTLFIRYEADRHRLTRQVDPHCQWVMDGEGTPTRKYDGTCTMLDDHGRWWARREIKPGQVTPPYFVQAGHDEITGKTMGWIPIGYSSWSRWHAEAIENAEDADYPEGCDAGEWTPGTYELIGPRVNGNPERSEHHALAAHAKAEVLHVPELTFDGIRAFVLALAEKDGCEGIVWHHPDGRMAKIKAKDFRTAVAE